MNFDDLVAEHGSAPGIPDEKLYSYLVESKEELNLRVQAGSVLAEFPLGREVRRRAKSDLFFLARFFCWCTAAGNPDDEPVNANSVEEETYRELIDFFVKKDDSKSIFEQDRVKKRLLLWPRGGLKSTLDVLDCVQWILNFPAVRILIVTGNDDLANGFVTELKGHFLIRETNVSWMNLFFPEFCVDDNRAEKGAEGIFVCPVWAARQIERVQPTVSCSTVLKARAGNHYEVIKADDCVNEVNSENKVQCEKIIRKLVRIGKMLEPGGYYDKIGTTYSELDEYARELDNIVAKGFKLTVTRPGLEEVTVQSLLLTVKVLVGRAVLIKPEAAQSLADAGKDVTYADAGEDGCYILIPKRVPFSRFVQDYDASPLDAEGQYNQRPNPALPDSTFTRRMMLEATLSALKLPEMGPVTLFWDLASKNKKDSDFSACTAVMWDATVGTGFLIDYTKKKYSPTELAQAIVDSIKDHLPLKVGIEDTGFAIHIQYAINDIAQKVSKQEKNSRIFEIAKNIEWVPAKNNEDEKYNRIMSLHPEFVYGRMKFSASCPLLESLYEDFEGFPRRKKDDGPDSLAYQLRFRPIGMAASASGDEIHYSFRDKLLNWQRRDIFEPDIQDFMNLPELVPIEPKNEMSNTTPDGLENILGAWWTG